MELVECIDRAGISIDGAGISECWEQCRFTETSIDGASRTAASSRDGQASRAGESSEAEARPDLDVSCALQEHSDKRAPTTTWASSVSP